MWPCKCPIHLSFSPGEVPPTACQLCASEGNSSLPASSCPQMEFDWLNRMKWCLWVKLDCELGRWGGKVFSSWGWWGLCPPSPLPHSALLCLVKPRKGRWGPLSAVLARSPMVGGVWLQRCYEVTSPFWVTRSLVRRTKHPLPTSSPQCGLVLLFRHPRPAGLRWISKPSLDQRHEAA